MKNDVASQIKSFILPVTVLFVVPLTILWAMGGFSLGWRFILPWDLVLVAIGVVLMGYGLYLLTITIQLFVYIGKGTLAPWAPTRKLVVIGPYRYVRNPMISGVLITLLGETIVFGSAGLLIWFACFFALNYAYFMLSEEPGLEKRFGEEYSRYKKNVPRWIPRLTPWTGAK